MRIVFLDTTLDSGLVGGAHTFLHKILRELANRGEEVHIVTKGNPTSKTAVNIENAGAVFHNNIWSKNLLEVDAAEALAQWLNNLQPDVFVVSVSADVGWLVLPLVRSEIATVIIGHNDSDTFYSPASHYSSFITKAIGVSDEVCRNYRDICNIPAEDIKWIPYGVSSSDLPPVKNAANGALSIAYVGRLEDQQKRASDLIGIVQSIAERKIDFVFRIIGDGVLYKVIKTGLSDFIDKGIVELTGWLPENEVLSHLRESDIYVLPSAYEGFCISLVEAIANGCCPVVTDIESGNKQLVQDGQNGFVVPIGGISDFADKIELLSKNPELLFSFRRKAWESGRYYSVRRMGDSYIQLFQEAITKAKRIVRKPVIDFPVMNSCRSKYPKWLRRIKKKLI